MSIEPIAPDDVQEVKNSQIPDYIIEAFNELIVEKWNMSSSRVLQKDAMSRALEKAPEGVTSQEIYANKWFDVEPLFRSKGWKVKYDKPAYCESYAASYEFSKDKQ